MPVYFSYNSFRQAVEHFVKQNFSLTTRIIVSIRNQTNNFLKPTDGNESQRIHIRFRSELAVIRNISLYESDAYISYRLATM